jgi:hypothetical protein
MATWSDMFFQSTILMQMCMLHIYICMYVCQYQCVFDEQTYLSGNAHIYIYVYFLFLDTKYTKEDIYIERDSVVWANNINTIFKHNTVPLFKEHVHIHHQDMILQLSCHQSRMRLCVVG